MKSDKFETDRRTVKATERKLKLRCSHCPPNQGENAKRQPKRGPKKPKYKNKRG